MANVGVLGGGAFGLTLADLLAHKGNAVTVWVRDPERCELLQRTRIPGKPGQLRVHEAVRFTSKLDEACVPADVLVSAVASYAIRPVCESILTALTTLRDRLFVNVSKGIEDETLLFPSQIFAEVFGERHAAQFGILSGPSLAAEVCQRIPTVVTSCSASAETAAKVQELFFLPSFRVYTNSDCRGVELGGALKNVIAVAAGICDGLGFGANTKSALITRGLAELTRAGVALGARPQTLYGLAGLGDLVTTSMSPHSRNRTFGELVGRGVPAADALAQIGAVVEGYHTARAAHDMGKRLGIELPITDAVHAVLHEDRPIGEAMESLLMREPKPEN